MLFDQKGIRTPMKVIVSLISIIEIDKLKDYNYNISRGISLLSFIDISWEHCYL